MNQYLAVTYFLILENPDLARQVKQLLEEKDKEAYVEILATERAVNS